MARHHYPAMFRAPLILTILLAAVSHEAAAQWVLSADVTAARFWGGSHEVAGDRSFRPYRPTILGIGLERPLLGIRIAVRGYYASASLALEGREAFAGVKSALDLHGVAVELSYPIASLGESVRVMIYGGPVIEVWDLADQSSNTRAGAGGSIGLQVALGRRLTGVFKTGVAVTSSPFAMTDLAAGFEPRALWRREVSGRLRYRL